MKEGIYLVINGIEPPVPAAVRPKSPAILAGLTAHLYWWLTYSVAIGVDADAQTPDTIHAFFEAVHERCGWSGVRGVLTCVNHLHRYRSMLSRPLTPSDFSYRPPAGTARRNSATKTKVIPESQMAPMLEVALHLVTAGAADVTAAIRHHTQLLEAATSSGPAHRATVDDVDHYLNGLERRSEPVPASRSNPTQPDWPLIGLLCGQPHALRGRLCERVKEAGERLGLEPVGLGLPVAHFPAIGGPWLPQPMHPSELQQLRVAAIQACLIVILFGSGLRLHELLAMPPDAAVTTTSATGATRYRLRGRLVKGQGLRGGPEAEWVCSPHAHTALAVLRDIEAAHLEHAYWMNGGTTAKLTPGTNIGLVLKNLGAASTTLNVFTRWVNRRFSTDDGPFIPGELVPVNGRALRKTLARYIASTPGGTVALKRQFKHVSPLTSEMYAGGPQDGLLHEIETQRRVHIAVSLLDACDTLNDGSPAKLSPHTRDYLETIGPMIASEAEIDRHLQLRDVRAMPLNMCVYDSAHAKCWTGTPIEQRGEPRPHLCQQVSCNNSYIGSQHREAWKNEEHVVTVELAAARKRQPKPTPLIRSLEQRQANAREALAATEEEPHGPPEA
ncbi:MAG: hypothetical protein JJU45_19105 [Acidimicrobiia bacterium]|nr:hypothetical protein [Acidimicrobiia bacterium]